MKLIIIYGPPAVGKLTVAKELATRTGYKLFHNHLSVDLVGSLYEFGQGPFWPLVRSIRNLLFLQATKDNLNLIFTFVYVKDQDDKIINSYMSTVEKNGGEVCLVQLTAHHDELTKRVTDDSRKKFLKVSSATTLEGLLSKGDHFSPINGRESLTIDNTHLTPAEVAEQIIAHFHL